MQIKHKPGLIHIKYDEIFFGFTPLDKEFEKPMPTKLVKAIKNAVAGKSILFGRKSYGQGENTLTDHRSQIRIDNRRLQGKHLACQKCSGCGKGNPCPIL